MSFAMAFGHCIGCGKVFSFNPMRVPSSSAVTGQREPICRTCFERINQKRIAMGLGAFPDPLPGAYEPCDADDLSDDAP